MSKLEGYSPFDFLLGIKKPLVTTFTAPPPLPPAQTCVQPSTLLFSAISFVITSSHQGETAFSPKQKNAEKNNVFPQTAKLVVILVKMVILVGENNSHSFV